MGDRVVVDTSVMIAALISAGGDSRAVLRLCLEQRCQTLMGQTLFAEYEEVFGRPGILDRSPLSPNERDELLDAFLSVCEWTPIFFLWRPNLPDETDNHLVELAVAGGATSLITHNFKDFRRGEPRFPQLRIETPKDFLKRWRTDHGDDDD
jgi:putative PIN family toxin of toxin-antitoxin system